MWKKKLGQILKKTWTNIKYKKKLGKILKKHWTDIEQNLDTY